MIQSAPSNHRYYHHTSPHLCPDQKSLECHRQTYQRVLLRDRRNLQRGLAHLQHHQRHCPICFQCLGGCLLLLGLCDRL